MRFQNFNESIPEAVPEVEEHHESDQPTNPVPFNNLIWCCSVLVSLVLGIMCLTSYPQVYETEPEVFIFTALYVSVEAVSGSVALLTMGTCFALAKLMGRSTSWLDYIGPCTVCMLTTSYIAHVLALPVTLILLYSHPSIPLLFKLFIGFECIISAALVLNLAYRFTSSFQRHPAGESRHHLVTEAELDRIRAQIKEARSRSSSLAASEPGSSERRQTRSTSNYLKRDSSDTQRKRSVSDAKLRLNLGKRGSATQSHTPATLEAEAEAEQ